MPAKIGDQSARRRLLLGPAGGTVLDQQLQALPRAQHTEVQLRADRGVFAATRRALTNNGTKSAANTGQRRRASGSGRVALPVVKFLIPECVPPVKQLPKLALGPILRELALATS